MQLIDKLKQGNQELLQAIYHQHKTRFVKIMKARFPECDVLVIEDAYSEAVEVLFNNINQGKLTHIEQSIESYIFAIARNKLYRDSKKAQKNLRLSVDLEDETEQDVWESERHLMSKCLEQLGERCQKLLRLFYYSYKSLQSITSEMGFGDTQNASAAKYKCSQKLKKRMLNEMKNQRH